MAALANLEGGVFGRWTVVRKAARRVHGCYWLCHCQCGKEKEVYHFSLLKGDSLSCGCLALELKIKRATVHGGFSGRKPTTEYTIWINMKERCYNPNCKQYGNYGARGIAVCDRWVKSYPHFLADMGPRPSRKHSLDRKENDGPYSPENCRWVLPEIQQNNKRNTVYVEFMGARKPIQDVGRLVGHPGWLIRQRVRQGWTVARAAMEATRKPHILEFNGRKQTATEWAVELGHCPTRLLGRIYAGWSAERALTTYTKPQIARCDG